MGSNLEPPGDVGDALVDPPVAVPTAVEEADAAAAAAATAEWCSFPGQHEHTDKPVSCDINMSNGNGYLPLMFD